MGIVQIREYPIKGSLSMFKKDLEARSIGLQGCKHTPLFIVG
jgi:hypothetical protein